MSKESPDEFDVSVVPDIGMVRIFDLENFPSIFVTRLRCEAKPKWSVAHDGTYIVAFSRICTHMGGHLVGNRHDGKKIASIAEEYVIRCPCHLTCFDLCNGGLVVIGQATAKLPQVELQPGSLGKIRLVKWRGLPYGETDP